MDFLKTGAKPPCSFARACRFSLLLIAGAIGLPAWAALPIQHWTHSSGARVYLIESPVIPMLDVELSVDGGSRRDPAAQAGLAGASAGAAGKHVV